jgi:hypothetical protein
MNTDQELAAAPTETYWIDVTYAVREMLDR